MNKEWRVGKGTSNGAASKRMRGTSPGRRNGKWRVRESKADVQARQSALG